MKLPRCFPDFLVVLTLLGFGLGSIDSARAVAWVARHGLSGAQYQSEFNQWTGQPYFLRPICVSGYEEGGQARYAAIWAKQAGSWSAVHGWTEAGFVTQVNTLRNQGWRPTYLCAFGAGGQALFNGIFEPTSNSDIVFQPSLTWTEYNSVSTTLTAQGYRLIEICPFNVGTQDLYAGLWEKPKGNFLNGLEAQRIPDPTTAGDFTRRFKEADILSLQECFNRSRQAVWKVQPKGFLQEAFIDVDGTIAQTYGECKEGIGLSYKGSGVTRR